MAKSLVSLTLLCLTSSRLAAAGLENIPIDPELVEIRAIDPSIIVELRYAGTHNITGHAIYPTNMPALVRPSVAERLVRAQNFLRSYHFGLKIWDAWRPQLAQVKLWELTHNGSYVADPASGNGSLHTWGVAVDATLVDASGHDIEMPTGFDEFTPAAMLRYKGEDEVVKWHLRLLQRAMTLGGFYGLRTEWWHFCAYDWKKYGPIAGPR